MHAILTSDMFLYKPLLKKKVRTYLTTKKQQLPVLNHFYYIDTIYFRLNSVVLASIQFILGFHTSYRSSRLDTRSSG